MNKVVVVAGFFPPPITGQGLATARLAELLSGSYEVICVNLREGEKELDLRLTGRIFQKISSYKEAGQRLSAVLESLPKCNSIVDSHFARKVWPYEGSSNDRSDIQNNT